MAIQKFPKLLIILLKRFEMETQKKSIFKIKVDKKVEIPFCLNLKEFT